MPSTHIVALAGGVGGAKLALGLAGVLPPEHLTIVVNTGDDEEFHGLHVSPDLDTVMYTLAGLVNPESGWGVAGDTFRTLEQLERLGAPTWFMLGDRDMAVHIRRTQLLREGWTLTGVTDQLRSLLGVRHRIVPMSDAPVRTRVDTDEGDMAFQEYFVKHRAAPRVRAVRYEGAGSAQPSPAFVEALDHATALVICPSNPMLSIEPILAVSGVRERIAALQGPRIAVSPLIGGEAVKGPTAKILDELGEETSAVAVAGRYAGLCDIFVLDGRDAALAPRVRNLDMRPEVAPVLMTNLEEKLALARRVCRLAGVPA